MTRWSLLLSCGAWMGLSACGPTGEAMLATEQEVYSPGSELTVRLHNVSFRSLHYNLCYISLQREGPAGWVGVQIREPDESCPAILLNLKPGEAESTQITLDSTLAEGTYRFSTSVELDGERRAVTSNSIQVTSQAVP